LRKPVTLLNADELKAWRDGLLDGRKPATINRVVAVLAAAFELAASVDPRISNRSAWKIGLRKLRGANARNARNVVLTDAQVRSLVAHAIEIGPEFGLLIETMAVTGARRSQLARLTVADLQDGRTDPRVMMPSSLKGKGSKRIDRVAVPIPRGLAAKLRASVQGRAPTDLLLPRPEGNAWRECDPRRPFQAIATKAGLDPADVTAYALRHTSITRMLVAGIPVRIVAKLHDTSVMMIEQTYSASIDEHADSRVRGVLLDLDDAKVVPIARRA
jgi:integrase